MKVSQSTLLAGLAAIFLAGCAHQAPATSEAPIPNAEMARLSGRDLGQLQRGHAIYMKQCSQCHIPMLPKEVSEGDWHIVVPGMAWNAGIEPADEEAVLQYLLAARATPTEE